MKYLKYLLNYFLLFVAIMLLNSALNTQERKLQTADTLIQEQSEVISRYRSVYGDLEYPEDFISGYSRMWRNREPDWHAQIYMLAGVVAFAGFVQLETRRKRGSLLRKSGEDPGP